MNIAKIHRAAALCVLVVATGCAAPASEETAEQSSQPLVAATDKQVAALQAELKASQADSYDIQKRLTTTLDNLAKNPKTPVSDQLVLQTISASQAARKQNDAVRGLLNQVDSQLSIPSFA